MPKMFFLLAVLGCFAISYCQVDKSQLTKSNSIEAAKNPTSVKSESSSSVFKWEHLLPLAIGILLGNVGRQTEFKKFLLQKRIDIFSDFLKEAEICRRDAITSIFFAQLRKDDFDPNNLPRIVTTIFWPILMKKNAAKLILDDKFQTEFEEIIQKINSLTIRDYIANADDLKIQEIENLFDRIEVIFTKSIGESILKSH
jgi:hypothetical protein